MLRSIGYEFSPSKYGPRFGYSRFQAWLSETPTDRFFDPKMLEAPTFDNDAFHMARYTRSSIVIGTVKVLMGEFQIETHRGEELHAFCFGGNLWTNPGGDGLLKFELTSPAPIFSLQDEDSIFSICGGELTGQMAEIAANFGSDEQAFYTHLASLEPQALFLSSLATLKMRLPNLQGLVSRERCYQIETALEHAYETLSKVDAWDGNSPTLSELFEEQWQKHATGQ